MSRSYRKPWYKDRGMSTHAYWSSIRGNWKIELKKNIDNEDFNFTHEKSLINDYDYSDYCFNIAMYPKGYRK